MASSNVSNCLWCGESFVPRSRGKDGYTRGCSISCGKLIGLRETILSRFWKGILRTEVCWNWQGKKSQAGYGAFMVSGKMILTHRFSWELHNGPIPDKMHVCHKCDTPSCVRPDHLFLGTPADNASDRNSKGRQARGQKIGNSKYTEEQVIEFKKAFANRESKTIKEVAEELGIPKSTAYFIGSGITWKHID